MNSLRPGQPGYVASNPDLVPTLLPANQYGGMTPGEALGGALTMQQPQQPQQPQQSPQMAQLLSIMPADFAAQITPEQLAALTPDQMTQMIAKFSQPRTPNIDTTLPVIGYQPGQPLMGQGKM
jgi:hypothetical protein